MNGLATPFTGILISILVYLIGVWLFKKSRGFFLFTPLLAGMVLGIIILILIGKYMNVSTITAYKSFYKPGGDIIF